MREKAVRDLRKIAKELAGGNEALYKFYYREAKKLHKKVSRAR